jgi:glycosyltransferase involved in cell wall biosynthesis
MWGDRLKDSNVRLCVVTTIAFTMRVFLLDQLVYLARNGFDITIICDEDSDLTSSCPPELKYQPLSMDRTASVSSTVSSLLGMYRILRGSSYDIIQYATPKAALLASLTGWLAGIRVRLYCQWGIRYVGMAGWKRYFFKKLEQLTCWLSTDIAPDSFGNLDFSLREGLYPREKGTVIHYGSANGVNMTRFDAAQRANWGGETRRQLGIDPGDFIFGWVGRVTRDKGVNELIDAFTAISCDASSAHLLMVGFMEGSGVRPDVLATMENHPRVHYVGLQYQIEKYYAAMDVLVVPSYREGFGSFALEAQSMEIPVISTDIPGPQEAIINGETGILVPPQDVDSLIEAMLRLENDQGMRRRMGKTGRELVKQRFEQQGLWEKICEHRRMLARRKQ